MRKQLSVAVILALSAVTATAGEDRLSEKEVPPGVISAFQKAYPNAKNVKYEREEEGGASLFEVEFKLGDKEMEAIYDGQGKLAYTEEEMHISDLPLVVKNTLDKEYPKAKVEEAEKLANPDGSLRGYEVEIKDGRKKMEIELDASGKIVKIESESEKKT